MPTTCSHLMIFPLKVTPPVPSQVPRPCWALPLTTDRAFSVPETGEVNIPLRGPQNKDPDSRRNNPASQWESKTPIRFSKGSCAHHPLLGGQSASLWSHLMPTEHLGGRESAGSRTWSCSVSCAAGLSLRGSTGLLQRLVQVEYGWSWFSRIYCPGGKVTSSAGLADHCRTRKTGTLCWLKKVGLGYSSFLPQILFIWLSAEAISRFIYFFHELVKNIDMQKTEVQTS